MQAYAELEARFRRMLLLRSVDDILHWDAAAVMPSGSAAARAEQLALLKVMEHELLADPTVAERLDEAEAEVDQLDDWQRANLREMRRLWVNGAAVPSDLVDAFSRACSLCERSWRRARPEGDFQVVAPLLEEV
ncbi:MAG: carboxypeptidase M32, partial [Myxococcales bacterium]|nr:carboxypeptidase M32 [Myxococcales bacterium]